MLTPRWDVDDETRVRNYKLHPNAVSFPVSELARFLPELCALYTQAASAGARMIEALRSGILILALPPTIASVAMLFIVHHKRNQVRQIDDKDGSQVRW